MTLSSQDSRHALRSLRLRPGQAVTVSDDAGLVAEGSVEGEEGGRAVILVAAVTAVDRPSTAVSVALAPPKGDRLAWAVQKLGELGVEEVIPLRTERGVRDWDAERVERAVAKLQAVAREAGMQSRQPFITKVLEPRGMEDAVEVRGVVVALDPRGGPLASALVEDGPAVVRLLVGPEGGFTDSELHAAAERGAAVATMGSSVLRTETAAVVGAALVLHRHGRVG